MIIKKLAAPLINEKILHEAEYCYIATAAISEQAFDFVKSRLHPKCKIDIVTGLDSTISPAVLKRILKHYQDRISLHIYTKNFFHPNVYIFDLPYRKAVAFIGSGNFTMEGIKDSEEIFYKIKDPKEIENLKSWFTGYYEFSTPLTEAIAQEYEWIYPSLRQREIASRKELKQLIAFTGGFTWESIKFKNQYFKKEDYLTLANNKAYLNTPAIQTERKNLKEKLLALHELIKRNIADLKLFQQPEIDFFVSEVNSSQYNEQKVRSMWLAYGEDQKELTEFSFLEGRQLKFKQLQLVLKSSEVDICLRPALAERVKFRDQMGDTQYRNRFFKFLANLKIESKGNDYWFEIIGEKRTIENFQNEDAFWDFIKSDQDLQFDFVLGKTYWPGAIEINADIIAATIQKDVEKLVLMYRQLLN